MRPTLARRGRCPCRRREIDRACAVRRCNCQSDVDAPGLGKFDRVVEQVRDQLAQQSGVARAPLRSRRRPRPHRPSSSPFSCARGRAAATASADELFERDRFARQVVARFGFGKQQHAVDHRRQAPRFRCGWRGCFRREPPGRCAAQRSSICAFALMTVSGVLSSCDASEMNCRSRPKASSRRSSIASNAAASAPSSSRRFDQPSRRFKRSGANFAHRGAQAWIGSSAPLAIAKEPAIATSTATATTMHEQIADARRAYRRRCRATRRRRRSARRPDRESARCARAHCRAAAGFRRGRRRVARRRTVSPARSSRRPCSCSWRSDSLAAYRSRRTSSGRPNDRARPSPSVLLGSARCRRSH